MNVYPNLTDLMTLASPLHVAIGVFDGVHLGHQAVLRSALMAAEQSGGTPVVVSFDRHPLSVLRPAQAPQFIYSPWLRRDTFASLGFDHLLELSFTQAFALTSAEDFAQQLAQAIGPHGSVSIGTDWRFGAGGTGDASLLKKAGLTVHVVPPVKIADRIVSSTHVRSLIATGQLAKVEACLGSEWSVDGIVQRGQQLARQWGVPTANIPLHGLQLPPYGVYFVDATIESGDIANDSQDGYFYGLANLGLRPTVEKTHPASPTLEVHFLELVPELVGRRLLVHFLHFHRPEKKFASINDLKTQILQDVAAAQTWWDAKE
jgi:riboflavin kinase/FMN adenylyltransferase